MKTFLVLSFCIISFSVIYAQNPEWINYIDRQDIHSTVIEGDTVWVGTSIGLIKLNKTTGEETIFNKSNSCLPSNIVSSIAIDGLGNKWIGTHDSGLAKYVDTTWTVYTTSNSGLPSMYINSIVIDGSGNKWIGTYSGGLAKYVDTTWTVYTTSNSSLPSMYINSIAIDGSGNKWIGTYGGGLAKFIDTTWKVYTTSNSDLPSNNVLSIAIDSSGNKWIGTMSGLIKYDDTTWTIYNSSNSDLPSNIISSIAIDGSGNKWIGTVNGLAKFVDTTWTVYTTSNSGLPYNWVLSIAIDSSGNKWIGTDSGLAVYKEGGVVTSVKGISKTNNPKVFSLFQNYPNPFNSSTLISYHLPASAFVVLKVYDVLGREIETLVNEVQNVGNHSEQFNATKIPSGAYFYRIDIGTHHDTKKLLLLK